MGEGLGFGAAVLLPVLLRVVFMDQTMLADLNRLINDLVVFATSQKCTIWLVGGAVRDLLCGKTPTDLDLAVSGNGFAIARAYADRCGAVFVPLDAERATGRIVTREERPITIDMAQLRAHDIAADLRRRDFTVNAMALPLQTDLLLRIPSSFSALIDPTNGRDDLRLGVLRPCSQDSLRDDPLRILRAARLGASLGLRPVPELAELIGAAAPLFKMVAAERIRDELLLLLASRAAAPWLRYLDASGVLTLLIPELEPARSCEQPRIHFLPVLAHSLETVAALDWIITDLRRQAGDVGAILQPEAQPVAVRSHPTLDAHLPYAEQLSELLDEPRGGVICRSALLKFAALIHDNAKPQTRTLHPDGRVSFHGHQSLGAEVAQQICRRLRMSRQNSAYLVLLVREHMRPGQLRDSGPMTARAVARLFRDLDTMVPDLLLHELADHLATRGPHLSQDGWRAHLAWVAQLLEMVYAPVPERQFPLVNGHDLIETLNLMPGPQIGVLLREIAEAQAAGEISSRAEALHLARSRLLA